MVRVMLLLLCSVTVTACGGTTRTYQYASWDNMDYYDGGVPSAAATDGP